MDGEGHPGVPNGGGQGHKRDLAQLQSGINLVNIREQQHEKSNARRLAQPLPAPAGAEPRAAL
eukprot:7960862-Pyramimonas_sp.AAC.1